MDMMNHFFDNDLSPVIPVKSKTTGATCFTQGLKLPTLIPRLMVQTKLSPGMTDAIVTEAPNLVNVSVIHVVSISSLPSAIGTRTFFDMFRELDDENFLLLLFALQ